MGQKIPNRLSALREMLKSWRSGWLVRATRTYKYIESEPEAFARGYQAALTDVIEKIETDNY